MKKFSYKKTKNPEVKASELLSSHGKEDAVKTARMCQMFSSGEWTTYWDNVITEIEKR